MLSLTQARPGTTRAIKNEEDEEEEVGKSNKADERLQREQVAEAEDEVEKLAPTNEPNVEEMP